jgi:hypothetical protein
MTFYWIGRGFLFSILGYYLFCTYGYDAQAGLN